MLENDRKVIEKYEFTEDETEFYIEKMGQLCEDNGMNERKAARICINWVLQERR